MPELTVKLPIIDEERCHCKWA